MDQRKIEHFVAVANDLSFTRAAQRVSATQSSVSAAVSPHEKKLGVQLIARSARRQQLVYPVIVLGTELPKKSS